MESHETIDVPLLPVEPPPKGTSFWLGTWTGRILILNAIVFFFISFQSRSLWMPDTGTLLLAGAKDPVGLAKGQFWRLVNPMFIHIGILHFAINSYTLYIIGWHIEQLLGGWWFLLIYALAGVSGNIASALFSLNLSAGASGALFGLLGVGFWLEHAVGKKIEAATGRRPRNRVYAMTLVVNLGIGFFLPFIDNSAHIGGLFTGLVLSYAMINIRSNRLQRRNPLHGVIAITFLILLLLIGTWFGTSSKLSSLRIMN